MLDTDIVTILTDHLPDDMRQIRDSIAQADAEIAGAARAQYRELHGRIKELRNRCDEAGHSLIIVLAGTAGTRRRMMRNRRDERRTCLLCGTEEVGEVETGLIARLLLRKTKWKFVKLNGPISRIFTEPEWYFETLSVIRNFSFPTEVVLYHAFPPRLPRLF